MIIGWFSCGVTSAVACKIALSMYQDVELYYIDTGSQDPDSLRFLKECEKWYGQTIHLLHSAQYADHFDVIEKKRFVNGPTGAACTYELKKKVRYDLQDSLGEWDGQVWGFDSGEEKRAQRFAEQNPVTKPLFPLIEKGITKENAAYMLEHAGIGMPLMYRLGYRNNNCIGCVKGGMGYWNKIRVDYPSQFNRMAVLERKIGHACLKETVNGKTIPLFLDTLDPKRGDFPSEVIPSCDLFCELEFMNV